MGLLSSTGTSKWGFELPAEGWHEVRIHDTIEVKGKKDKPDEKMMAIPLVFGDSSSPSVTIYALLDKVSGLRKIVDVCVATGLHKKLKAEKQIDLMAGVDEAVIKSEKFTTWVMSKLAGMGFNVKVKHEAGKDKEGNERMQANVVEIAPSENQPVSTPKPVAASEEGGW